VHQNSAKCNKGSPLEHCSRQKFVYAHIERIMIQPTNQSQRSRPSREAIQTIPSFSPAVRCKPGKAASENPFLSTLGQVSTQPNNDLFTGEKMYFMKHGTYTVVLVCERGYGRSSPKGLKRYCFWGGGRARFARAVPRWRRLSVVYAGWFTIVAYLYC
jgi:hypothetical protein